MAITTTTELESKTVVPAVRSSGIASTPIPRPGWLLWGVVAIVAVLVLWNVQDAVGWVRAFINRPQIVLQWLLALVPGAIILHHLSYLLLTRRKQFRNALDEGLAEEEINRLQELYFGATQMTLRYTVPAVLVILLSALAIAAITYPDAYLPWLYGGPQFVKFPNWPSGDWGLQILRGAAYGFAGAYVYIVLLLTERAFRRDITSGVAMWSAAMCVLGPICGGVAALLLQGGAGPGGSFTRDAVFFVAGMLPRQFAGFVQGQIRRFFSGSATQALRTQPLTMLRGVGPDVEERLEEEGIHDVSALAYASPHQLMRSTTFAPRQIVDWIDEALLIVTLPDHWQALEKVGVTGVMDLAWYFGRQPSIAALATEIRSNPTLLGDTITRLYEDAQVRALYQLYWDHAAPLPNVDGDPAGKRAANDTPPPASLVFAFKAGIQQDARDRLMALVRTKAGVRSVAITGDTLTVLVDPGQHDAVDADLRTMMEIQPA
jgi:hypothetical protein